MKQLTLSRDRLRNAPFFEFCLNSVRWMPRQQAQVPNIISMPASILRCAGQWAYARFESCESVEGLALVPSIVTMPFLCAGGNIIFSNALVALCLHGDDAFSRIREASGHIALLPAWLFACMVTMQLPFVRVASTCTSLLMWRTWLKPRMLCWKMGSRYVLCFQSLRRSSSTGTQKQNRDFPREERLC